MQCMGFLVMIKSRLYGIRHTGEEDGKRKPGIPL